MGTQPQDSHAHSQFCCVFVPWTLGHSAIDTLFVDTWFAPQHSICWRFLSVAWHTQRTHFTAAAVAGVAVGTCYGSRCVLHVALNLDTAVT